VLAHRRRADAQASREIVRGSLRLEQEIQQGSLRAGRKSFFDHDCPL
jgi:hypothetical protein